MIPQILVTGLGLIRPLAIAFGMDANLAAFAILPAILFVASSAYFGKLMNQGAVPAG